MSNGINKILIKQLEKQSKIRAEYQSYLNVFTENRIKKAFTLNKITRAIINKDWSLDYV